MLSIDRLSEDKYQVINGCSMKVMTLEEVIVLLSTPVEEPKQEKTAQEIFEEFWDSLPAYPGA